MSIKLSRKFSVAKEIIDRVDPQDLNCIDKLTKIIGADSNNGFGIYTDGRLIDYAPQIRHTLSQYITRKITKNKEFLPESREEIIKILSQYCTDNPEDFGMDGTTTIVSKKTGIRYVVIVSKSSKIYHSLSVSYKLVDIPLCKSILDPKYSYITPTKRSGKDSYRPLVIRPLSIDEAILVANILDKAHQEK